MRVFTHRDFDRRVKKLKLNEKTKLKQRLALFMVDPDNPVLNNHALKGRYGGYYSINATGDLRALYKLLRKDAVLFVIIDTHSNLYG